MDSNGAHRFLFFGLISAGLIAGTLGLGCNWGLQATHPLQPEIVVKLMKQNGFNKVKLFEADPGALNALGKSGIEVMVGIPNYMLAPLAGSVQNAINWVSQNVSDYVSKHGVDVRYVAVGNEPFLKDYGDQFTHTLFPALRNIQAALIKAGLGRRVKATVPFNGGVYFSKTGVPSGGDFRDDVRDLMISMVKFMNNNGAPITVNIYPFLNMNSDPGFPPDFAFFDGSAKPVVDGSATYTNVFDANFDTLVSTLQKYGLGSMPIIVGEVGWPTDGGTNADTKNARRFNQQLVNRIIQRKGTPKRPTPPDIYIFALIDEDNKSVDPGNFERHWGIFQYDGATKYQLDLGNNKSLVPAKGVSYLPKKWCVMAPQASTSDPHMIPSISYACQFGDCTSLGNGSSCGGLDARGNASYAFNMYYQTMNQSQGACQFNNLGMVTAIDPSKGTCRFIIQLDLTKHQKSHGSVSVSGKSLVTSAISILFVATWISFGF